MGYDFEKHTETWHCPRPGNGEVYEVVREGWSFPNGRDHQPHHDIYEVRIIPEAGA